MSGIAELLANLGYEVSGSDARRSDMTDRLATLGVRIALGSRRRPRRRRRRRGGVVGDRGAATRRSRRRARRHVPVIPRAEMLAELMRLRYGIAIAGRARQDDDHVDGGAGARAGRARSDGGDRRPAERVRQQRAARARRLHGRRGGRERSVVPEAVAVDRGDYEHRSRAHGELTAPGTHLQQAFVDFATRCRSTAPWSRASTTAGARAACRA